MSALNAKQQEAADGFFQFLFSKERELIISGGGGVGKTFLMGHLIDTILPRYMDTCSLMGLSPEYTEVVMCATTNKAAEVLAQATKRPTQTIHSFLNLKVQDDFTTGESTLIKTGSWVVHAKKIIFIDECSMIDRQLYQIIQDGTSNCKVIYVGDHCQLAPVQETISPIYVRNLPFYNLIEPMRNAGNPALVAVCAQLRDTVETGEFKPIQVVPGSIDWYPNDQIELEIQGTFGQYEDARILAYTNKRVMDFNDYVRHIRNLPPELQVGEHVINNSMVKLKTQALSVEEEITIHKKYDKKLVEIAPNVELEVQMMDLQSPYAFIPSAPIPVDRKHYLELIKYFQKIKNWRAYFKLKNEFPDLRPSESCTVHKSQGSTYETVFIDLDNLSSCHQPKLAARLLYVAFTRAKSRVVLFGELSQKYGGLIYV